MLAIWPAFVLLNKSPTMATLLGVVTALSIVHAINVGPVGAMLGELFPRSVRATGAAIVYSLGAAVFGGFAQFFVTALIIVTSACVVRDGMRRAERASGRLHARSFARHARLILFEIPKLLTLRRSTTISHIEKVLDRRGFVR